MIVFSISKVVEDAEEVVEEGLVGDEEEEAGVDSEVAIMDITHTTDTKYRLYCFLFLLKN